MDPVEYRQVAELFRALVRLPAADRRRALEAVPDDGLRRRVAAMLDADAVASQVLDRARAEVTAEEAPPARIGPWEIVREIGRGGMGVVYEVEQAHPRRRVALKVVHPSLRGPDMAALLRLEAQAMAELLHPGIPQVYGAGGDEGAPWLAMELVEGVPWRAWAASAPLRDRVAAVRAIGEAVAHAHDRGIVHRDLKPENVLVAAGRPKVLDFGIAAAGGRWEGVRGGSAAYMAPEQRDGRDGGDARVDVHALGLVLAETLGGARDAAAVADPELAAVVRRATAQRPEDRYPTARALADDLGRWLDGWPVEAYGGGAAWRARKWAGRHAASIRAGVGALALASLVAAAALGGAAWRDARTRDEAEALAAGRLATTALRAAQAAPGEADARWRAFLELDENRGTRALGEGWRRWAAALEARGDDDAALDAWAQAYAVSPDDEGRRAALVGLAGVFRSRWAWEPLDRALDRLAAGGPLSPELRRLRAETDLALGHPVDREALPAAARPLVDALAPALRTEVPARHVMRLDVDGDGAGELIVEGPDATRLVALRADTSLARVLEIEVPPQRHGRLYPVDADEPLLVGDPVAGGNALYGLAPAGPGSARLVERFTWPGAPVHTATWADPEGDGRPSLFVGLGPYERALRRLDGAGARWVLSSPSPETDRASSDVDGLQAADLDGDGRDELVAAVGPWRAYDVRVLTDDGRGGLRLVARRSTGFVQTLAVVRGAAGARIAAVHGALYPSVDVFDATDPYGGPPGVLWMALRGDELVEVRRDVPDNTSPTARPYLSSGRFGDFDGDGITDAAVNARTRETGVWVISGADGASFVLAGLAALAAADLDGDGDDELLCAEDGRLVVLGTGDDARARRPPTLPVPTTAPPLSDPYARTAWLRAEELVSMGLVAQAARRLEDAAALLGPEDVQRMLARAGALRLEQGAGSEAVALYRRAAALTTDAAAEAEVLDGLARAAADWHLPEVAVAALDRRIARLPPGPERDEATARRARLAPLAEAVVTEVSLAPLDPRWQVRRAAAVEHASGGGIGVAGWDGGGDVLVLPLRWDGGRLGLVARLDVEALTWGSELAFTLRPAGGGTAADAAVQGGGGGGFVGRMALCRAGPDGEATSPRRHEPPEPERETLTLTLDLDPTSGAGLCAIDADGVRIVERKMPTGALPPAGDWELAIVDGSLAGGTYPLRIVLRELRLVGATVRGAPDADPVAVARRALADGDPDAAWPALSRPPASDTDRLLGALAAGREDEARAAFTALLAADDPGVPWLLFRFGEALEPVARERPEFWDLFFRAWGSTVARPETPRAIQVLDRPLLDGLTGATAVERELLLARARASAQAGRIDRARADLDRLLARAGPEDHADGRVTRARVEYATLEHRAGRAEAARRHAQAAIDASPTPHLTAERLARVMKAGP